MISYRIELNSKPGKGTKEHTLMLRITCDKKHARIALPYSIEKRHFNPQPGNHKYVRQSHTKHARINQEIDDKIQAAKEIVKELEKEGKVITALSIKQRMRQPKTSSFFDFAEVIISDLKKNKKIGSYKKAKVVVKSLREYREELDLSFQEVDVKFLESYEAYLESLGKARNTIHGYLRKIRAIYYKAIQEGMVVQASNPFFSFRLKAGKVHRYRLSEDEIRTIESLELPVESRIWHVKNAFMFSFYNAGIRASDLIQLKWKNIVNGRLMYQMHKTQKIHSLILKDKPKKILGYYKSDNPEDYIFPFLRNDIEYTDPALLHNQISSKTAILNKYLGKIAEQAEINKKISTHTARHSFADIARKKSGNLYNLSKTLGHTNLKITEAYLASFDEDAVDSTLDEVFK